MPSLPAMHTVCVVLTQQSATFAQISVPMLNQKIMTAVPQTTAQSHTSRQAVAVLVDKHWLCW